jgi:multiple antibiotic resistance protein
MTIGLDYVFAIFFLVLGPLKVMPVFAAMTAGVVWRDRLDLAWRGAAIATGIVLLVAFVCTGMSHNWRISPAALAIAAGLFLVVSAFRTVNTVFAPELHDAPTPTADRPPLRSLALSPLAIPAIVTPYGVAAIILFMGGHTQGRAFQAGVLVMLLLTMALNFGGMLIAGPFVRLLRPAGLKLLGWIFGVLQAALAIEFMLAPVRLALRGG